MLVLSKKVFPLKSPFSNALSLDCSSERTQLWHSSKFKEFFNLEQYDLAMASMPEKIHSNYHMWKLFAKNVYANWVKTSKAILYLPHWEIKKDSVVHCIHSNVAPATLRQ